MIKTYEEFNWNPFEKEYNDYLGLDDINALDEFNEIAGNRYENLMKKLVDGGYIKYRSENSNNNVDIEKMIDQIILHNVSKKATDILYVKNFYGEWVYLGIIYHYMTANFNSNPLKMDDQSKFEPFNMPKYVRPKVQDKHNGLFLRRLKDEYKDIIIEYFKNMNDKEYNDYMIELKRMIQSH